MSDVASHGQAALRAALDAVDATVKVATDARAALRAALGEAGEGEVAEEEAFDPGDRENWLTLQEAAGVAKRHEKTIERWLPHIGGRMFGGRWYVSRRKLLAYRVR